MDIAIPPGHIPITNGERRSAPTDRLLDITPYEWSRRGRDTAEEATFNTQEETCKRFIHEFSDLPTIEGRAS